MKASFLCARLHFLCRLEQTIFYMKQEIEQKELGMGNFQGYPSLLRQIKHRVSFAQQKAKRLMVGVRRLYSA